MSQHHPDMTGNRSTGTPAGRIIMVEDDQDLRDTIVEYLTRVGFDVTAVATGLAFYHALAEQTFSIAVIDLGLPDMDGLQLADYIRNNTEMRCIILTARDSVDARVSGYDAGADLYLVKPVDCRELSSALSRMLRRTTAADQNKETGNYWRLNRQNSTLISPSHTIISLTSREMDFLLCLAVSPEMPISRDTILKSMKYPDDDQSHRALESLIRRLRRKIERACGSSPILTSYGVGYSFSAPLTVH